MLHRLIKEVAPTEAGAFERGGYEKAIMLVNSKAAVYIISTACFLRKSSGVSPIIILYLGIRKAPSDNFTYSPSARHTYIP